jgi:hypothetical protein
VVGIAQETHLSARLVNGKVEMLRTNKGEDIGGDGTVPRISAFPQEMETPRNAMYAGTQHGSLQNADSVITHLTGLLTGMRIDLGAFKKDANVALEVEDVFFTDEPIAVRARPGKAGAALEAQLWRSGEAAPLATAVMKDAGAEWLTAAFGPPGTGAYRVTVGGTGVETAQDSFVVGDREGRVP